MENSKENDRKLVIGEEQLEKLEEGSVVSKKSDTIASSNAWLENITERLYLSSKRVSELSNKIAATRRSSRLSVDSDDSITLSQKMSEMETPSKSKQSITERFKNMDAKSSKQGRDRQLGSGLKTPRSANVASDSKSRLRRVGSPSVLSDKSSFTYRSDDYSTFSRGRKARSADKERRNSFSNIKVGPAMTRQLLEQERTSFSRGSRSNLSASRSNSDNKMKDFSTRSGSKLVRKSKTALQNTSTERLNKSGTRSRSNCSVSDARFVPERRSFTKRASLTELINLYYSTPTRRSTTAGLYNYRMSISKKDSNNSWGGKVVKDPWKESIIAMSRVAKTPQSSDKNEDKDVAETPTSATRSLVSLQGKPEDSKSVDESMNNNDMLNESASKTPEIKSIMKTCNEDKGENKNLRKEDVEEEKKKSEKGSRRLSLIGAETLIVPSDVQEEQEKKRKKSTRRKSSLPKSVKRKSGDKGVANDNNKKEMDVRRKSKEQAAVVKDMRLEDIDMSAFEIKRETSELAGLNIIKNNDDIPTKVTKEPKIVTQIPKTHDRCKSSDDLNSKLTDVNRKLRNNNNIQTIKVYRQEKNNNDKNLLAFNEISLVEAHNGVGKSGRTSVDKCKTNKKNKILSAIHGDRLLKRKGGKLVGKSTID
ncbi:hypothetical protein LSTR_LSTR001413 [Laodelphax striatellus]|uniref:Uncharacterized protein n=1 Tax=Laodelphax striatellus TaxID=195883 RepID=A0A482XAW9_LAOST|nr:hypothetical protein LSTR_LSTR001413 [Laodelphax striatellus]